MSKGSTASEKTLTQPRSHSAWARGPPQKISSAPSTRSQSSVPSHVQSVTASHSRRRSALGQGLPVKEGVSVPRNNVGSVRQGSSLHFGSIDDATAPVSSSPTATPVIRHESVKTFGSLPATAAPTSNIVNGKIPASSATAGSLKPSSRHTPASPSIPSSTSAAASSLSVSTTMTSSIASAAVANITPSTSSSSASSASSPSSSTQPAFNVAKLFQSNLSASRPSSDTTSPPSRPSNLPHQSSSTGQHAPQTPVQAPPLSAHPYTPFAQGMRPPRGTSGPDSPAFSRAVPNGTGPQSRPIPGPGGPGGPPIPASPTLAPPVHSHSPSSAGVPPQQLPKQHMAWPYYYHLDYTSPPWYYTMQPPHGMGHTPHAPGLTPQSPPRPGIPLSPRTQPPPLPPGTPSVAHAVPHSPLTPQPPPSHAHQPSAGVNMTPPPPTPSTSTAPGRSLITDAAKFDPTSTRSHKITIRSEDRKEIKLESLKKPSPQPSTTPIPTSSPRATSRRTASVRTESKKAKWKREEQARLEQEKREAVERAKQEEQGGKGKEEEAAKWREEQEQEEKREEKEGEQERAHKAEEKKLRQEEERKRRAEEERRIEERLREKEREGWERRKRERAELAEKERAEREAERQRLEEAEAGSREDGDIVEFPTQELLEVEEGEVIENGEILEPHINGTSNLSRSQEESSRIDTSKFVRRQPGPPDINAAKEDSSAPPLSALLTARKIDRLDEVEYPEGIRSPKMELNQNAKDGKFRYDRDFLLQFMAVCKEKPPTIYSLDILGIKPVDQSSSRDGSDRHRPPSGPKSAAGARSASIDLGLGPFKPGPAPGPFAMGQFGIPGTKFTNEERFLMSQGASSAFVGAGPATALLSLPALARTPSQGGPGGHPKGGHRTRSKRGMKRTDPGKVGSVRQFLGDVSEVSFA